MKYIMMQFHCRPDEGYCLCLNPRNRNYTSLDFGSKTQISVWIQIWHSVTGHQQSWGMFKPVVPVQNDYPAPNHYIKCVWLWNCSWRKLHFCVFYHEPLMSWGLSISLNICSQLMPCKLTLRWLLLKRGGVKHTRCRMSPGKDWELWLCTEVKGIKGT